MAKIVRGYNLDERNVKWLTERAARETMLAGRNVSASDVLDRLVTFGREADERKVKRERLKVKA